jgi:hypothetical protein|tara:strand:- start:641 stop:814 length:174 start_codon:yes stop_codon:yes gene_type:complete
MLRAEAATVAARGELQRFGISQRWNAWPGKQGAKLSVVGIDAVKQRAIEGKRKCGGA